MSQVHVCVEARRGCGYRKPGKDGVGVYLMGDGLSRPCGLLPFPMEVCPCCGEGIKQTRGWTWITPSLLLTKQQPLDILAGTERRCERDGSRFCRQCPAGGGIPDGRHGLIWVGEKFYKTPEEFRKEASSMGVSRKIKTVPRDFVLGETWVYLAHKTCVWDEENQAMRPGIFSAFKPSRIDLVIADEHDVPERALKLAEEFGEHARIVKVIPQAEAQTELFQ